MRVGGEGGHDGLCHLASLTFTRIMRRVIVIIIMIVHGGIYNLQGCKLVITFTGTLELMNNNDIISTFTSLGFHKRSRYGLSVDLRMLNHL